MCWTTLFFRCYVKSYHYFIKLDVCHFSTRSKPKGRWVSANPSLSGFRIREQSQSLILPSLYCLQSVFNSYHRSLPHVHWLMFFFPIVWYQKLDSGKSPTVSNEVIKKVTSKRGVRFKETTGDHKVSILLCPVISRIGSDAEAAITSINGKGLCPST